MKKLLLLLLPVVFTACTYKQNTVTTATHVDSIVVSMDAIGDFKIGMTKESVEKLLNRKITLTNISSSNDDLFIDSIVCNYKNTDYALQFMKDSQGDSSYTITLSQVSSQSPLLKTSSGIGIGDDIHKIIDSYNDYRIDIIPGYEYSTKPPTRIKSESEAWLYIEGTDRVLVFYMDNNKVDGMGLDVFGDD